MHGFEKEGIRITPDGELSPAPHPEALGSSLMHPLITTDFAECQLEFMTRPQNSIYLALKQLEGIHVYATKALKEEWIWPFSMPPRLPANEQNIPLAVYGHSSPGKKKTLYRQGIGLRYGRRKLTISGVHYNFSPPPSVSNARRSKGPVHDLCLSPSDRYFHIIRNLYRKIGYLTYLFGASPAFDKSFQAPGIHRFQRHKTSTYYGEFATSLRAGDIGYTSAVQDQLPVNYNSLKAYRRSLDYAVSTPCPAYEKIPSGQMNANYLQAEYELYAPFRPKQQLNSGERLLDALANKGVGFLEVRLPDIDPAYPDGIDPYAMGFLHLMIEDCLKHESPPFTAKEIKQIRNAYRHIIWKGRKKGICIPENGKSLPFHSTGQKYCEKLYPLAEKKDRESGANFYRKSVSVQIEKWKSPELTPSGKILSHLIDENREFVNWGLEIAEKNARYFQGRDAEPEFYRQIETQTLQSVQRQQELEAWEKEHK